MHARLPDDTTRVTLDATHEAAIEAAMDIDRGYEARGAVEWTRLPLEHELCPALGECLVMPVNAVIIVTMLRPGLRARALTFAGVAGAA